MFHFRQTHGYSRQPACPIHGLEGLTANSETHYDRLLWLTEQRTRFGVPEPVLFLQAYEDPTDALRALPGLFSLPVGT